MARLGRSKVILAGLGVAFLGLSCIVFNATGLLGGSRTPTAAAVAAGGGAASPGADRAAAGTPTAMPAGKTRESPAPLGQAVVTDDKFEITVLRAQRGASAIAKLQSYNMLNPEPKEDMEYLLVTISVRALGDPAKTQRISNSYFRVTGAEGVIYDASWNVMGKELASEVFGGAVTEGEISFEVAEDDAQLVLIYSGLGTKARYLTLEE